MKNIQWGKVCAVLVFQTYLALNSYADTRTHVIAYEYDLSTGNLAKEIAEPGSQNLCLAREYSYDGFGNRTAIKTRNCSGVAGTSAGVNDEALQPAQGSGFEIAERTEGYQYDAQGRFLTTFTNAIGQTETKTWDPKFGSLVSIKGPNGLTTSWAHNEFGEEVSQTNPDGTVVATTYELCQGTNCSQGQNPKYLIRTTRSGYPTQESYFDSRELEVASSFQDKDGANVYTQTVYDKLGRISKTSRPYKSGAPIYWTTNSFDAFDRVIAVSGVDSNGNPAVNSIAYQGLVTTYTNSRQKSFTQTKDVKGLLIRVEDANQASITYSYDANGNLVSVIDAAGNTTTYQYDLLDRKVSISDPDQGVSGFVIDALGQVGKQTDAKGQVVTFNYDKLGRVVVRNEPDLVSTWSYDTCDQVLNPAGKCSGQLVKESGDNGYARTYLYDALNRPTAELDNIDQGYGVSKSYDAYGRISNLVYPGGLSVTNQYSASGALIQINNTSSGVAYWKAVNSDPEGRINEFQFANGIKSKRSFDANTGLLKQTLSGTATVPSSVFSQSYVYDSTGNLTQRYDAITGLNEAFGYDNLDRLLSSSSQVGNGALIQTTLSYDAIGNILTKSDVGTYSYGQIGTDGKLYQPHAVSKITMNDGVTPYASYSYDSNGNMLSGAGRSITWASWNMPKSISGTIPGKSTPANTQSSLVQNLYNVEHERVKEIMPDGTIVLNISPRIDEGIHVEKRIAPDNSVTLVSYLYATGYPFGAVYTTTPASGSSTTKARYFHIDNIGSITAISDDSANVIDRRSYDAWGKRRNLNGTASNNAFFASEERHGYTSHEELNELALIQMNGRVFDPAIAKFASVDASIQFPENQQSYNGYSYLMNSPFSGVDPSGYEWDDFSGFDLGTWPVMVVSATDGWSSFGINSYSVDFSFDVSQFQIGWGDRIESVEQGVAGWAVQNPSFEYPAIGLIAGIEAFAPTNALESNPIGKAVGKGVKLAVKLKDATKAANNAKKAVAADKAAKAVRPGQAGTYGELKAQKREYGETEALHMDHQPSFSAQVAAREAALGRTLTPAERATLKASTPAIASPRAVHQQTSPTYGGRNTPARIAEDASDLSAAAVRDRTVFDEAMRNR